MSELTNLNYLLIHHGRASDVFNFRHYSGTANPWIICHARRGSSVELSGVPDVHETSMTEGKAGFSALDKENPWALLNPYFTPLEQLDYQPIGIFSAKIL